MSTTSPLSRARKKLVTALAAMLPFCRGTLSETHVKCGKSACACASDPARRHGPYYQWTVVERGKVRHRTLCPEDAEVVRLGIARREVFEEWSRAFAAHMEKETLAGRPAREKKGLLRRTRKR